MKFIKDTPPQIIVVVISGHDDFGLVLSAFLYGNVSLYAVSLDLPFAQGRWCGANGVNTIKTLSDYSDRNFGLATGTFIEGLSILTRSVFIVDEANSVCT